MIAVFFRSVPMPGGTLLIRRPPAETRPALGDLIDAKPKVASYWRFRAQEDEVALDFPAAEADWRKYAQLASNYTALADYFHRREEGAKEIAALGIVVQGKTDPIAPLTGQLAWKAVERTVSVADEEGLPDSVPEAAFASWIKLHPADGNGYRAAADFEIAHKRFDRALETVASFGKQFPEDRVYAVRERAAIAAAQGSVDSAIAIYDAAFDPLWPAELSSSYFALLEQQGRLREFLGATRTVLQNKPTNLNAAARLFLYYQNQKNSAAAERALQAFRLAKESSKEPWTTGELWTLGRLFESFSDVNEAARCYYAMYSVPGATDSSAEQALGALANLLLNSADQPIAFGSGDLSMYRDIAKVDESPGFLNGLFSMLFNSTSTTREYRQEDEKSAPYFRRSTGARLVNLLAQRFPKSSQLAGLRAAVVQTCATYADDACVLRDARAYLSAFPNGAERVQVALLLADALARGNRTAEEFALYDRLLKELARRAQGVPIGGELTEQSQPPARRTGMLPMVRMVRPGSFGPSGSIVIRLDAMASVPIAGENAEQSQPGSKARSPEYDRILQRYLSRLEEMKRFTDVLRVYRGEIDRNPNDPGLYREFAAYLDANRLDVPLIETYRRAMAKFPERNWYHALARWYLRQKRTGDFQRLTKEVTGIFSGTQLDRYFANVVGLAGVSSQMYLQVCLYAHQRFPGDLVFVRDLLGAYQNRQTLDVAAYDELLRSYWFYDGDLKQQFFQNLSEDHRLTQELEEVRKANASLAAGDWKKAMSENPAAVQFVAEAEAWTSHFEAAAPGLRALAEAEPGKVQSTERAASIYRSLAAYDGANTGTAVGLAQLAQKASPRDRDLLERVGDIYADRDELNRAAPIWNGVLRIEPGKPESYLSAATVFWDYYRFADALRLIADGRRKFGNPTLFAYEDGAIEEGQRDYRAAIHQYAAGAMAGDERAQARLLRLCMRKPFEPVVDREMAGLGDGKAARDLRIAVLEKEVKRGDLETLLSGLLERAKTGPDVVELAEIARRDGFDALQERALETQVALTNDPVDRIRLRMELARFYANRNKAKAQEMIEALYKDNPRILGVVRAAVDFETGQQQWDQAIHYLLDAAGNARPDLANQFTLEAARDEMSAKQFDRARTLLAGLLRSDPYRSEYLAALGTTYVLAGDDAGYEQFVLTTIKALQGSPLPAEDKTVRVAELRRGLIPTLTRRKEFAQGVEQYIEVLNRYPEDAGLATEAAGYAVRHGRAEQLVGFYRKTIQDAPRDYRWPIVLARVETRAEDFPAAISDYAMAMKDRPDRADVVEARAVLEKRILRFEDAIQTYSKLYELSYRNPEWMREIAELHARLGQADEAVKALRTAVIGQHMETAAMLFQIADRLDQWGLVQQAAGYAVDGAKLDLSEGMAIYVRVMARARRMDVLIANFQKDVPFLMPAAKVIAVEYSPEEKAALEAKISGAMEWADFAREAEMAPLEAKILRGNLAGGGVGEALPRLNQLQLRRGEFEELGAEMERYVKRAGPGALSDAASAYIAVDERENALRVLEQLLARDQLGGPLQDWYLATLSRQYPDRLVTLARDATQPGIRDRATQYAIANTDAPLALRAVAARGTGENPLWNRAFTALTGLYFVDPQASIAKSFTAALGSDPDIGTRVKFAPDRTAQLTGTLWFYYGARYGDYLNNLDRAEAAEFLPASLEATPGNPEAYMALGRYYAEKKQTAAAVTEFRETLQLDAARVDARDEIALALWSAGKKTEAAAEWRAGVATLERLQSRGVAVPPTFWPHGGALIAHVIASGAARDLRPDLERWIREYARINGSYQLDPLLTAAFDASLDAKEDTDWVLAIAEEYSSFDRFLENPRLTAAQRIGLERRRLGYLAKDAASANGDERRQIESEIDSARVKLIGMLLDEPDVDGARAEWKLLLEDRARKYPVEAIRLAGGTGTLEQLLAGYRENPEQAPGFDVLQKAAMALHEKRHADESTVAEFMYSRELDAQRYDTGNFIGLADVYLERGQTDAAVKLLRRMNLISGAPFETFVGAAELLRKHGKNAEAIPFLRDRVKAAPWDAGARWELAKSLTGADRDALLSRVVGDVHAEYRLRVEAAEAAQHGIAGVDASSELGALASGAVTMDSAEKPYRVAARMVLASKETDAAVKARLLREALAIAPDGVPVRVAVLRAVLDANRDSLALSTSQMARAPGTWFGNGTEAVTLAEDLSRAAERVDDLAQAISYQQMAVDLQNAFKAVAASEVRLKALQAEQPRRLQNAARQPVIGPSIEQKSLVEPRILARSAR